MLLKGNCWHAQAGSCRSADALLPSASTRPARSAYMPPGTTGGYPLQTARDACRPFPQNVRAVAAVSKLSHMRLAPWLRQSPDWQPCRYCVNGVVHSLRIGVRTLCSTIQACQVTIGIQFNLTWFTSLRLIWPYLVWRWPQAAQTLTTNHFTILPVQPPLYLPPPLSTSPSRPRSHTSSSIRSMP